MKHKSLILVGLFVIFGLIVTGCGGETPAPAEEAQAPAPAPGFTPASVCEAPDVVGLDQDAAKGMITGVGLQPVQGSQYDPSVAEGAVISQDPPAGTRMEPCQGDVTIVISLGPVPQPTATPAPTDTPVPPTMTPTPSPVPPTPTPYSGPIPFAAPSDPNALNPALGWQPGGSNASSYDLTLNPGALTLIAGSGTDQWKDRNSAPLVVYPIEGNFEIQVKVIFNPTRHAQVAGIGVRSSQATNTWLRIARCMDNSSGGQTICTIGDDQGRGFHLINVPYADDTVWLKIQRYGSLFTLSYSANGSNWVDSNKDYVFEMPASTEIFLTSFSAHNDQGVIVQFYDLAVLCE